MLYCQFCSYTNYRWKVQSIVAADVRRRIATLQMFGRIRLLTSAATSTGAHGVTRSYGFSEFQALELLFSPLNSSSPPLFCFNFSGTEYSCSRNIGPGCIRFLQRGSPPPLLGVCGPAYFCTGHSGPSLASPGQTPPPGQNHQKCEQETTPHVHRGILAELWSK